MGRSVAPPTWRAVGAAPGGLPIEQPARFEFLVHAAAALELALPSTLLARADEVIE